MSKFAGTKTSLESKNIYLDSIESNEIKKFELGQNTSKILNDDPKLLLFTLSRYKFVSKILSGCENVLEIGCQEGFGMPIIKKEIGTYTGIDFYKPYIKSCINRIDDKNIKFVEKDILDGPIDGNFDGIFALDVFEHIEKLNSDIFMKNISSSLTTHGTVVLGIPSLESQSYASKASKIGHVNCMNGSEFKRFLELYFHNVYLFSMNDEVLHTGFLSMSHYLLAICTSKI